LPLNVFYRIAINQNANQLTGAGVADPTGALLNASTTGGPYVVEFALGARLSYTDGAGNRVSMALTGGGLLELRLGSDSMAQQLRIVNAARRSILSGQVRPGAPGASGRTPLPLVLGAAGVKIRLKGVAIGSISLTPVSQNVPIKTPPARQIRHGRHGRRRH
jgi:hypothetical protein